MCIYSTVILTIIRVACYAEAMYLELFEDGWTNEWHQGFIETYFDTEYMANKGYFIKQINRFPKQLLFRIVFLIF